MTNHPIYTPTFKCPVKSLIFSFSFLFFSFVFSFVLVSFCTRFARCFAKPHCTMSHLLILKYLVKSWRCTLARSCEKEQQKHHINKLMASLSALPTRLFLIGSDLRAVLFPQLLAWNFFLHSVSLLSTIYASDWSGVPLPIRTINVLQISRNVASLCLPLQIWPS